MTQLTELGAGLVVLSVMLALAYRNLRKADEFRIKGLPQVFDRASYPELFDVWTKTAGWTAIIAFVIGLALLTVRP